MLDPDSNNSALHKAVLAADLQSVQKILSQECALQEPLGERISAANPAVHKPSVTRVVAAN